MPRRIFFVFILLILLNLTHAAKPITYIWDLHELDSLRTYPQSAGFRSIVQQANQLLARSIVAVTDKKKTISGNKHNYESLSIYWWPDPNNPNGPYIAKDGVYNPEYKQYDYPRLLLLVENLRTCSKAFYLTGNVAYYDLFCRQLDRWFINEATRMQPDFEYCQFIPGRNNNCGNPQGMIDAYNFNDVIESIRLVHSKKSTGRKRMKALKKWFRDFAEWMQTSNYGQRASQFNNNQSVAYDITLYDILIFTDNKSGRAQILNDFFEKRVKPQIDDEGKMPEELKRTRAYHYSIYNLTHLVDFCQLVQNDGKTIPTSILSRTEKAFSFLSRYADHKDTFPYQEISDWNQTTNTLKKEKARFISLRQGLP